MDLIGRNKIVKYIQEHPESRIALLTFLREFPYRPNPFVNEDHVDGTFQTDGFDCLIKVRINHFAKAINILELTSREEEINKWEKKRIEQEATGIGPKIITKSVTVVVTVPQPPDVEELDDLEESRDNEVIASLFQPELQDESTQRSFDTIVEYEQGLNWVNALFDAKPGTPEFEELLSLLPQVVNYEEYKLEFPKLNISELVKHRMDLFEMTPFSLGHMAGTEEELNLFLSGKLMLSDAVFTRLFQMLALRSAVTDQRFL